MRRVRRGRGDSDGSRSRSRTVDLVTLIWVDQGTNRKRQVTLVV